MSLPTPEPANPSPGQQWPKHILRWTGITAAAIAAIFLISVVGFMLQLNSVSLDANRPDLYALNRPVALTFLDQRDHPAGILGAQLGQRLSLRDMPPYLPAAFIAAEDRHFYQHQGIDPEGMLRAAIVNFRAGHVVEGGSTITQQLVKMLFLTPDRTVSRKLRELAGALALEHRLSKQQILELYLNRLYLGSGAYGVDAAAHVYFGKSARNVTVGQAAMLAALTRAPSAYSPRRDLEAAQDRANQVLKEMIGIGAITPKQARMAEAHPAVVTAQIDDLARNYFLDAAANEARQLVPSTKGDLVISTTLDPDLERAARAELAGILNSRGRAMQAGQGALVSMTTTGAVRALIGGRDYSESSFNRVTNAHRQPGSAFKAFVYLAALEHGLTPATVRVDQPVSIADMNKAWTPDNYTQTYVGPVTLEQAFAHSINTIAVQLGQEVGIANVVAVAHRLGIDSPLDPVPSLALGTSDVTPMEMTAAYASFATLGHRVKPYMVREIRSPDGTVLYQRPPSSSPQVISENIALEMNDLLYQVVQVGTGHAAEVPGHDVAGKTGTSADYRDAWFVGFSPDLVTGVWVGNDDSSPMKKVTGGLLPAQIWGGFMRAALQDRPATPLPRAEPVATMPLVASQPTAPAEPGPLDGLGRFFGGLFGSAPAAPQPATPPPQRSAQGNPGFFPDGRQDMAATTPNGSANTSSDGGTTNATTGIGRGGSTNIFGSSDADQSSAPPTYPRPDRRVAPTPPQAPSPYAGTPGYDQPYGDPFNGPSPYGYGYPPPRRYRMPPSGGYFPPAPYPPPPNMPPPSAYPYDNSGSPFGRNQDSLGLTPELPNRSPDLYRTPRPTFGFADQPELDQPQSGHDTAPNNVPPPRLYGDQAPG